MKDPIKLVKPLDYKKVIQIDRLIIDYYLLNWQIQNLKVVRPNLSTSDFEQIIYDDVVKATKFQYLIVYLKDFFEFNISDENINNYIKNHVKNPEQAIKSKNEQLRRQVQMILQSQLIVNYFEKEFKIVVSDDEIKAKLNDEYKKFNRPIRDILNNVNGAFDRYKMNEQRERTINVLLEKFNTNVDVEKIKTQITNALKQNEVFTKNIQFEGSILKSINNKLNSNKKKS